MDVANERHQHVLSAFKNRIESAACFDEAEIARIGVGTAAQVVTRRAADLALANVRYQDQLTELKRALEEGKATLVRESARRTPDLSHHYWMSEKVSAYLKALQWAKIMTYRALQAVEYDYQASFSSRTKVIAATEHSALDAVLKEFEQRRDEKRAVFNNISRPDVHVFVSSLKDELLKGTESSASTPEGRLTEALLSPKNAYYGEHGEYMGQAIRFNFPIELTGLRCAERVWKVGASIIGRELEDAGRRWLYLYKSNTFASHYCDRRKGEFQVGRVSPSASLLGSPGVLTSTLAEAYGRADLQPSLNLSRQDLETAQIGSEELAGRGLFGEYFLLFPPSLLKTYDMTKVRDVLLRFQTNSAQRN